MRKLKKNLFESKNSPNMSGGVGGGCEKHPKSERKINEKNKNNELKSGRGKKK